MAKAERNLNIDALRGFSFVAVILLNLLGEFRVPFFLYLEKFHTEDGILNHVTDWIIGLSLDQKGFTILSLLFGVGIAMMAERHSDRIHSILFRRFIFLLGLGLIHLFFIFSGDILTLYALCGLFIIPLVRLNELALVLIIFVGFCLRIFISRPSIPLDTSSSSLIQGAYQIYGGGSFVEAFHFRLFEIKHLIAPLLLSVWPRTFAFMLVGILAWKRRWLLILQRGTRGRTIGILSLMIGTICTGIEAYIATKGLNFGYWNTLIGDIGVFSLAVAYSTWILRMDTSKFSVRWLAPLGRMSLTTYLTQTVLLGFIFYGYGLGFFGKLGSFSAAVFALGFYLLQILVAQKYFLRFQQGPIEHVWRKFTYRSLN